MDDRFDIIGSTFVYSSGLSLTEIFPTDAHSLLSDAQGNHCSSFPATLLEIIRAGTQLSQYDPSSSPTFIREKSGQQDTVLDLLRSAQSFDPHAWAVQLQPHSPATDIELRTHIGHAHRAAVCIYLSRVLLSICPEARLSQRLDLLVDTVISHLSFIRPDHALFKATPWPAFIAGAETDSIAQQKWVLQRFKELWEVEPWGLIKGALGVLESLWAGRASQSNEASQREDRKERSSRGDWVDDLRSRGVDWLII